MKRDLTMDFYHALNRGVDKRTIFLDTQDYVRFIHDMYEFNSSDPAVNTHRALMFGLRSRTLVHDSKTHRLVDIHGWCLMENHYHLLLSECTEGGLVKFLRKLNVGYAKYFNERYKRTGTLFQGRTKKVLIAREAHLLHILNYIHFNPLDFHSSSTDWRLRTIDNGGNALAHLKAYKWSSYRDYIGIKNFPSILTTSFFGTLFGQEYSKEVESYLKDIELSEVHDLLLE
jgi:putative transposase